MFLVLAVTRKLGPLLRPGFSGFLWGLMTVGNVHFRGPTSCASPAAIGRRSQPQGPELEPCCVSSDE